MRVNLHDFTGHPFEVELARGLAARGHDVLHLYAGQYVTGRGRLEVTADDPQSLRIEPVTAALPMDKYSPVGRTRFEIAYAAAWRDRLAREPFDVVVTANAPLFVLARMRARLSQRRWVLWHQDVTSLAITAEAQRRLPGPAAAVVGRAAQRLERSQVRSADAVVAIGDQFVRQYETWGLTTDHVQVIPNWAPLDDIRPGDRDNAWAKRNQLPADGLRLLYAGTLGRKHNPLLLLEMLDNVRAHGVDAHLVVCSEGEGADDLGAAASGRADVRILGFQPAEDLSDVLASGDVVVALLEKDAAMFSVPSKVLSYLAAGRPIVGLLPSNNPAAVDIAASGGFTSTPDPAGAAAAAQWLVATSAAGTFEAIGRTARTLAEERFGIEAITDRFEQVLLVAAGAAPLREGTGEHVRPSAHTRVRDAREQLKIAVRSTLYKRRLDLVRDPFPVRIAASLDFFSLTTVIDVGANVGQYGSSLRSAGYRGRLVSCEPLSDAFARLARRAANDAQWTALRTAVGDAPGTTSINVSANSYSSSVLPMTSAHTGAAPGSEYVATETVDVTTLAALVEAQSIDPARTWLKIDTQGFESQVLDGAGALLGSFAAVQLELSFVPLYDGQVLFDDLVARLTDAGLTLYGLDAGFSDPRTGRTLQCDGVFVRADLVRRAEQA